MQRTLLTLALITAAGTAFAQTATPPAASAGSVTTPSATAPSASVPSVPSQTMGAGGATATTPAVGGATVKPPSASAGQPSMSQDTNTANASPRLSGQAGIAQKRIEADGYRNVQGLAQGSDGLWHGRAMRGSAEVQVIVDRQGNVSQQ